MARSPKPHTALSHILAICFDKAAVFLAHHPRLVCTRSFPSGTPLHNFRDLAGQICFAHISKGGASFLSFISGRIPLLFPTRSQYAGRWLKSFSNRTEHFFARIGFLICCFTFWGLGLVIQIVYHQPACSAISYPGHPQRF